MSAEVDVSALPTIFDPLTCTRKGLCPVTVIRNEAGPLESHSLYFEQHGSGPEKMLFIMGLNSTSFSWFPQVDYLSRDLKYSVLVFDNRGVGNSSAPRGPYSTSMMAEDVIVLLDYLGWTANRDLHVIGLSLGGMIALELASRISDRIVSLTLAVTRAKRTIRSSFPSSWLDATAEDDPQGRTNRVIQTIEYRRRFEVTRPQQPVGALSQMVAGLTHSVSPERLKTVSASIPKVLIITGDDDYLVDPSNSFYMKEHMPEAEFIEWKGTGHGLQIQHKNRFNELLERVATEGRERLSSHKGELARPAA
ncbi:uncharacterized protein FIBRA_06014 [Fibroporia radiculosa]|uniref:AB hydrolase-1 domain-containing protein n=1 Tax=Fibroporia radiculosa TaxID=599839 RepID=J4H3U7_9APHY|nr:uncharacterized protein FIBRA_06014 [Fibroporia radiculosa]CCM03864.1 predicted protein [Fibroporia radiculosa]